MDTLAITEDALDRLRASLRQAALESSRIAEDTESWRWVAIPLVMALQSALVAALTGYETAEPIHVLDPSDPDGRKFAPPSMLLRRARSADYLEPPERLSLPISATRGAEKLITYRNAVVHGGSLETGESLPRAARHTLAIIRYLICDHPAFDPSAHALVLTHIRDHIAAIEQDLPHTD